MAPVSQKRAALLAAACAFGAAQTWCTAEDACLNSTAAFRCLPTSSGHGAPCVLDYAYNQTGYCSCQAQACVPLTSPPKTKNKQLLVVGDSISLGYLPSLTSALGGEWEVTHAPSFSGSDNNDNVNWHSHCLEGWLGTQPARWDAVTFNAGLHDLAYEDNEHLSAASYGVLLYGVASRLAAALAPAARIVWMRTTPVPTDPPANCTLIPGRLEVDVQRYNAVADAMVALVNAQQPQQPPSQTDRIRTCDLHGVITAHCGATYRSCDIAQCGGPHFSEAGFQLLGARAAACVTAT
jgi:hypothetical protein